MKVNVTFNDDDEDYSVVLTCFENCLPEHFQNDEENDNLASEYKNASLPELESLSSITDFIDHDEVAEGTHCNQQKPIRHNHIDNNIFAITNDMDRNEKVVVIFQCHYF